MAQYLRGFLFLSFGFLILACGQAVNRSQTESTLAGFQFEEPSGNCQASTIEEKLGCIEGLTYRELAQGDTPKDYRLFELRLAQPVDHANPDGPTFNQKLILYHKSENAPLVLQTSGYQIFSIGLTRLAKDLGANQIQVEHRFFATSTPDPVDWTKLTVEQSAADFHRIALQFKPTYPKAWVNTGASKGGMTSIYHRRFYPDDLAATVALVAPHSYSTADERYISFVDQVGGDKYTDCRSKLEEFQKALLANKERILPRLKGGYEIVGSASVAFEHAVIELPFIFWQYGNPSSSSTGCNAIPRANATPDKLYNFMIRVSNPEDYFSDEGLRPFVSYFYQAANQLGAPASKLSHIENVLQHKDTYELKTYLPDDAVASYDDAATMRGVQDWIHSSGDKIIMIYGEYDPWTAGAYQPRRDGGENAYYVVKGGNHGANHTLLSPDDKRDAMTKLANWLNIELKIDIEQNDNESMATEMLNLRDVSAEQPQQRYLEDMETEIRRRYGR